MKTKILPILITAILTLITLSAKAQTFTGTMTIGDYTRNNVVGVLSEKDGKATIVLKNFKMSKYMPFAIECTLANISITKQDDKKILKSQNVKVLYKGKNFDAIKVSNLYGVISGQQAKVSTMMGDKKVSFVGKCTSN